MATLHSFKDLSLVFAHPLVGTFTVKGQIGVSRIAITNTTERTLHDVAADGGVMISYVSGDNGTIKMEMQQTCAFHKFLLTWYNVIKTLADQDDVSAWASADVHARTINDGSVHVLTGVSPSKVPDKPYAAAGEKITWDLMAANMVQS